LKPGSAAEGELERFATVKASDPDLVKELEKRQVNFSGQYENPLINALLTWVLPAVRI
jgi:hypothetical protein